MRRAALHDFRVTDRILAETDPDAGDVVFSGPKGTATFPFVVYRRLSGPGGLYIDACEILDPEGEIVATRRRRGKAVSVVEKQILLSWEKKFELDGESVVQDVVDEVRGMRFPHPGEYTLRYSIYDDHVIDTPFTVMPQDPPWVAVPGPLDASLSRSTIAWLRVRQPGGAEETKPIWYGYEKGKVFVLVGPGEQEIPGLTEATTAVLVARSKEKQSLVAETECLSYVLDKDGEWDRIARDVMIGRRLNLTDGEKALERWRKECEMVALTPIPPPLGR